MQNKTKLCIVDIIEKSLRKPRDCTDILGYGERSDGVYDVYVGKTQRRIEVYCDLTTDGGGWTVCIMTFTRAITEVDDKPLGK